MLPMKNAKIKNLLRVVLCALCVPVLFSACNKVGEQFSGDKSNHIHSYDENKVTKIPTCTENGEREYYCSCGATRTEAINSFGHNYVLHDGKSADCTDVGWEAYRTCTRCDYSDYNEIPALGHDYGDWETIKDASCTENGEELKVCRRDETHTQSRETEKTDHTGGKWIISSYPTCESDGLKVELCVVCSEEISTEIIPVLGHDFGEWISVPAPNCTCGGSEMRICSNNENHIEYRSINAVVHSYIWENDEATHSAECEECGDVISSTPHEWSGGVCIDCGYKKPSEPQLDFENVDGLSYAVTGIGTFTKSELVIPSQLNGLPVTEIAANAFCGCAFITSITVPDSVTVIGAHAFSECEALTEVIIENCEGWQIYNNGKPLGAINQADLADPYAALGTLNYYSDFKLIRV